MTNAFPPDGYEKLLQPAKWRDGRDATESRTTRLRFNPPWTDDYYKTARTIFGHPSQDLAYDYSDRLFQWDPKKHEAAVAAANETKHTPGSANWYEVYLSAYFGEPVVLLHVLAGCNRSNGFSYQVFGYKKKGEA